MLRVIPRRLAEEDYMRKYGPDDTTTSTTTPNTTTAEPYAPPLDWWDGNTWIMGGVYDFQRKSISEMYLASIYFALTTITTVGYGDITPVRVYVCAYMCVSRA